MDIYAYYGWLNCGYPYLDMNIEFTAIVDIHYSVMETIMDIHICQLK